MIPTPEWYQLNMGLRFWLQRPFSQTWEKGLGDEGNPLAILWRIVY